MFFLFFSNVAQANPAFDVFVKNLTDDWVKADPLLASGSQYFSGKEQDALDRKLVGKDFYYQTPVNLAARLRRAEAARVGLEELKKFPSAELTPSQRISKAMIAWKLNDLQQTSDLSDERFVFNQHLSGLQVGLINFLTQTHPVRSARDVENYLERLKQLAPVLDEGIAEAKARAEHGVVPPKFILKATIDGLDRFLEPAPAKNILVASLDERASKVEAISAESRAASVAEAQKIVVEDVIPAFKRIRTLLSEQMQTATNEAGLWRLPRGAEAYAVALATYTTTDMTPDQIHELGLKEVGRIEKQMDSLLRELGYTEGTVNARYEKLTVDSQPPGDPDPHPMLLARYEEILRDAEKRAALVFDLRPKAPIIVRREPSFTEKGASAHYVAPAPDGTLPGVFYAPLPGPSYNVISMKTLVYHEGVPGHHFQIALQQELSAIPLFRQRRILGSISAFSEGWALYTEQLAVELGWYEGDSRGLLGQLDQELFRARRLVVDTGLHVKKWTRQQAVDYGFSGTEIDRYVVNPGQACSYKIGQLKILELRERAKTALGTKFSLRGFHNLILSTGEVPLSVLGEVVDEWIILQKAKR